MENFTDFLWAFLKPSFDMAIAILNYPVFGIPFWRHVLTLYLVTFVINFITRGTLTFGIGNMAHGISTASESYRKNQIEKQRQARSERIGFHPSDD